MNKELTIDTIPHHEWELLIYSLTARWMKAGPPPEDIQQEAWLALLYAAKSYDPTKGTKFTTWASTYIREYVKRFVRRWLKNPEVTGLEPEALDSFGHVSETPLQIASRRDTIEEVYEDLTDYEADLLTMRYIVGMSMKEIGDRVGVSFQRISQKMQQIDQKLSRMKRHEEHSDN